MADNTENRGTTSGNRESQSGSSSQQMNRPGQSGTTSQSGSQTSTQQSGLSMPGSKAGQPEDRLRKQPGGPGTGSSQYSNAGSTGTGSGQISPHNPASGQSSSSGRSSGSGTSSGSDRNT